MEIWNFDGNGHLPAYSVESTGEVRLNVYSYGAHITHWQPKGMKPILFLGSRSAFKKGSPIRGGIPICLPWFSKGLSGTQEPLHGTARLQFWQLTSQRFNGQTAILKFVLNNQRYGGTVLNYTYTIAVSPMSLNLHLQVSNCGAKQVPVEMILHTYFQVGDATKARVCGLENQRYTNLLTNESRNGDGPIRFGDSEVTRLYQGRDLHPYIDDPVLERIIYVSGENPTSNVIWNPGNRQIPDLRTEEATQFICLECGRVKDQMLFLGPGETRKLNTHIFVSSYL